MLAENLWVVVAVVIATSFVLLVLAFRSLVVPAKAALVNLLSVGAAYGVITLLFQTDARRRPPRACPDRCRSRRTSRC